MARDEGEAAIADLGGGNGRVDQKVREPHVARLRGGLGWGLGRKLRRVVDIERQRENTGDGGSLLLRLSRVSTHGQETRTEQKEAIGSNRKSQQ